MSLPEIDVVILTWNDGALLHKAVNSALTSEDVSVSVTIVDNGSNAPLDIPADDRILVIRNEENRGVAPGRSQGIQAGKSEIVCILDSDAELQPNALKTLHEALVSSLSVGLVAPVFTGQEPSDSAGPAPTLSLKMKRALNLTAKYESGQAFDEDGYRQVDFAIGACQMFRRQAHNEIGGLDTSIFYGPEDIDFCLRLKYAGWLVKQVRDAECNHPPRRRNKKLFTKSGLSHGRAVGKHLLKHFFYRHLNKRNAIDL